MHIIARPAISDAMERHPDAAAWLRHWWKVAGTQRWQNLQAVRIVYPATDQVDCCLVFNVKGNMPMTTAITAYDSLLLDVRPRPIRSKAAYQRALRHVERLMKRPHLSRAESEMVELLSLLIEQHEAVEHPTPECSPAELLEHLLEARALSKADLARQTGIPRSVISNVLAGRRALSKANAIKLARYFGVSLSLFIQLN